MDQIVQTMPALSPILCAIPVAANMIGRSERVIYKLIGEGKIRAVKSDGRTLIVVESLRTYAANLPAAKVASVGTHQPARLRY